MKEIKSGWLQFVDTTNKQNNRPVVVVKSVMGKKMTVGVIKWCEHLNCYGFYPSVGKKLVFNEPMMAEINRCIVEMS